MFSIILNYNTLMISFLWLIPLGWLSGALVNYLADVLLEERRLVQPLCPVCSQKKSWLSMIWPMVDQHSEHPRIRPWLILILSTFLICMTYLFPSDSLGFGVGWIWIVYFLLVIVIDMEHRLILHPVSLFGAGLGLVTGWINHGFLPTVVGGAAGFGIMLGLFYLGILFVRLMSRIRNQEIDEIALGFGDVNLSGVIGLLLGWPGVLAGLVGAIILGGVVSGLYLAWQAVNKRYEAFSALPYGPFLALSALFLLFIAGNI
jgi:leader peptidase (prepilin peptidase)/N-methyltransferase